MTVDAHDLGDNLGKPRNDRRESWLVHACWPLLAICVLVTLLSWEPSTRLAFDQTIESLYSPDDPRIVSFRASRSAFGGDEFIFLAYHDPDLLTGERVSDSAKVRLDAISRQLEEIPGIQSDTVQNLADALALPWKRAKLRSFVEGMLVGADGQTTCIVAKLTPPEATPHIDGKPIERAETIRQIRALAASLDPPAVVLGEPVQVHDMFRYVEQDGATLGWTSILLLSVIILLLFRSIRWTLLSFLVVQCTLLWTKAFLVVSHMQLSMVSSMLNSLVAIIGIASMMHVTLRYRDLVGPLTRTQALHQTYRDLFAPIFWSLFTTAAGFAALLTCHITPVFSFGIMMSIACGFVMIAWGALVPGGVLIGPRTAKPGTAPLESQMVRGLVVLMESVIRRPLFTTTAMISLSVLCAIGLFRLEVETDFSKNFRKSSPIVQALEFFENRLGGAGTWEVNFSAPNVPDEHFFDQVAELCETLREMEGNGPRKLTKVLSLADGISVIPDRIVFSRISIDTRLKALALFQRDFVQGMYNSEKGRMRIFLRSVERQSAEDKLWLIQEVQELARQKFPDAEVTGLFVLLANIIDSLLADQVTSTIAAGIAILLATTIAFRSLTLGLALLIPNLFPIVVVIGIMGLVNFPINIATAMIACVSMGLTVDSGIHYVASYRRHRQHNSLMEALRLTQHDVGLALVLANIALVIGFSVLTLSHFLPLVYFGVLVCVAMIGGLFGNLVLLPLILFYLDPGHELASADLEMSPASGPLG